MMYICNNCHGTFEDPDSYAEHQPYGAGYALEDISVCPYCGDTDFTEAHQCGCCGEYFEELADGICKGCEEYAE